jgi:hypothetical protein
MYLWKYWRESRTLLFVSMAFMALLGFALFKGVWKIEHDPNSVTAGVRGLVVLVAAVPNLLAFPFAFLAWLLGSFGVGRDLGEGSGSFIFTRPRLRAWFLWRDLAYGFAQIVFAIVVTNLLIGFAILRLAGGDVTLGYASSASLAAMMSLDCVAVALFAGIIFGVTYCTTIALKSSRGVIVGAGIVVGYLAMGMIVQHYWPGIQWPSLLLQAFQFSSGSWALSQHLGLLIVIRAAVMMLFPVCAYQILKRSEI